MEHMKAGDAFVYIVNNCGKTRADLARAMGRSVGYFRNILSRGSVPRLETFAEIVDAAGFDMYVRQRSTGESIMIDPPGKNAPEE